MAKYTRVSTAGSTDVLPSCAELADKLDVAFSTVSRAIARGEIAAVRIGRTIRIPWSEWTRLTGEDPRPAGAEANKPEALPAPRERTPEEIAERQERARKAGRASQAAWRTRVAALAAASAE